MQLGMIGLGRMGSGMVRRLLAGGHACVVYDRSPESRAALAREGARAADSSGALAAALTVPRTIWLMVPAAAVDDVLASLTPHLAAGDVVIDGGNSHFADALRRSAALAENGVRFLDVGVSGGVWGAEHGYCLMVGGAPDAVQHVDAVFRTLAPGRTAAEPTTGRRTGASTAEEGYLHCGPSGAGHFVKMVHNGIEYGLMAAYAEGLNLLAHAGAGRIDGRASAEAAPARHPERYRYDLPIAEIAEVWRRGSVVRSWLLDLTARALAAQADLGSYAGHVSDSGEGRWTAEAAIDTSTPAPVLTAALFHRFSSRGEDTFANRVLSAMRHQFGGHAEQRGPAGSTRAGGS